VTWRASTFLHSHGEHFLPIAIDGVPPWVTVIHYQPQATQKKWRSAEVIVGNAGMGHDDDDGLWAYFPKIHLAQIIKVKFQSSLLVLHMLAQRIPDVKEETSIHLVQTCCDTFKQKQGTESPMSNNLHYVHNPKHFAFNVSVYKQFSHFCSQYHHKLYQPKNVNS